MFYTINRNITNRQSLVCCFNTISKSILLNKVIYFKKSFYWFTCFIQIFLFINIKLTVLWVCINISSLF